MLLLYLYVIRNVDLLAGILTVTMDTLQQKQQVQALRFSDNELSTATNVETTTVNSDTIDYFQFSTPWIILIVFLSILLLLVLYWIFVLLIVPLTRKSSICRYIFPCPQPYGNFLTPATDIFLDVVHVTSGEQISFYDNDYSSTMFLIFHRFSTSSKF